MITLTPKDIDEFRTLYRKETAKELTEEQARAYAKNLIRLVAFAMKPRSPSIDS